jgi:hypothetical protein
MLHFKKLQKSAIKKKFAAGEGRGVRGEEREGGEELASWREAALARDALYRKIRAGDVVQRRALVVFRD